MPDRSWDWLRQAERDLDHAEEDRKRGYYEWACFSAQQAAEKAVKALHLYYGQEAWGHIVAHLLKELPLEVPQELIERARVLDGYYIPPRYPNGFPEGSPFEHFGEMQASEAIEHARKILEFTRSKMAPAGRGP